MTRRGRLVAVLGAAAYLCGWAFGSRPLGTVGVGLLVSVGLAWASLRLAGTVRLRRELPKSRLIEGDDVSVSLDVELPGGIPAASVSLTERVAGERCETYLTRRSGRYSGRYVLRAVARGRFRVEQVEVALEDAFGLARRQRSLPEEAALVVYPRLVELAGLFSESGLRWWDGRRLLLRRAAGFELHGVREYERGDSLRAVHWPSTARRGDLMVKDLEDAPRAEVAVVLDGHRVPTFGRPPETPFDAQVRAAGSIVLAHVRRGRSAQLVVNCSPQVTVQVSSRRGLDEALEQLATARPNGLRGVETLLAGPRRLEAADITVVTANLSRPLADALARRAAARQGAALVFVDAASYGGRRFPEPSLPRLQAAGVPVSIVQRGCDLRAALEGAHRAEAASG